MSQFKADNYLNQVEGLEITNEGNYNRVLDFLNKAREAILKNMFSESISYSQKALEIGCSANDVSSIIIKLIDVNQLDCARNLTLIALKFVPEEYNLMNTLGVILKKQGKYSEAFSILNNAANLRPDLHAAWVNIGNIYLLMSELGKALESYNKALIASPKNSEIMMLKASAHIRLGENNIAESILKEAQVISPDNIIITENLSAALYNQKLYEEALKCINKCIAVNPNNISFLSKKVAMLKALGRSVEAIKIYEKIIELNPNDTIAFLELGYLYDGVCGDSVKALQSYKKAYKIAPSNIAVLKTLCQFFLNIKDVDGSQDKFITEANRYANELLNSASSTEEVSDVIQIISLKLLDYEMYEKLGTQKDMIDYWSKIHESRTLIYNLSRVENMIDRLRLLRAHRICGAFVESKAKNIQLKRPVKKRINSKIRIGIMSSDLRMHPVGYFVWPIIEHLDRDKFEIYCYSFFPYSPDQMQMKFMGRVDKFQNMLEQNAYQVAEIIAEDSVDILFELGGKTRFNKTETCIYRPAPVQVSWLGYPHSLGFEKSIDYIVVDPYILPESPHLIIEKPFLLPSTWVSIDESVGFMNIASANKIPQDENGYITFGSMNASHKITPKVIAIWAEIMNLVPNSRFLYVRPEADSSILKNNFCKYMNMHGISGDRISFAATHTDHMKYYDEIDIALDTFPHTGGTITCEALWMGVPVVTLVGPSFFERLSYSNLSNCDLGDLCSFRLLEYTSTAVQLAKDIDRRRHLKNNLRKQILSNPLGNPREFSRDFSKTLMNVLGRQ